MTHQRSATLERGVEICNSSHVTAQTPQLYFLEVSSLINWAVIWVTEFSFIKSLAVIAGTILSKITAQSLDRTCQSQLDCSKSARLS